MLYTKLLGLFCLNFLKIWDWSLEEPDVQAGLCTRDGHLAHVMYIALIVTKTQSYSVLCMNHLPDTIKNKIYSDLEYTE